MENVTAKSYTLYDENGVWLGQVVLTSDGMFGSVTDWGNLSYSWRSFSGTFEEFILDLNADYLAAKLSTGLAYIAHSRKIDQSIQRYANKILPALQKALREEMNKQ